MIQIKNLRKTYFNGVQALRGVDLEISEGETLALVGESGCGKSTLARHLLNLEAPTEGQIFLRDKEISQITSKELARQLQMIFQDPAASLNPRRKVKDIVAEPLRVQGGFSEKEIQAKVTETLMSVGLSAEMGGRYPHMFSGGQKQRIGIARALITGAKTILCDEPVSALDVSVQAQVLNLLLDLRKERALSLLFISHDLGVVRYVADRIAVMYLGQIVEEGVADSVFVRPRHPYTRLLLDSTPVIGRPAPEFHKASELPSPKNPPKGCAFASRCHFVIPLCREQAPPLRPIGNVKAACHRADELDLSKPVRDQDPK
jgi:oligopeptide/dipeptide ABC transporter ATP-binding protein